MEKLEIGQIYRPAAHRGEGAHFEIKPSGLEMALLFNEPSPNEVEQVRRGRFEVHLAEINQTIFLLAKFGGLEWIDMPYDPTLTLGLELQPIDGDTEGYSLLVLLADVPSGTLRAIRMVGLGNRFSKTFRQRVLATLEKGIPHTEHLRRVDAVYGQYSSAKAMLKSSIVRYWTD
jgi:hypothetical protein